MCVRRRVTATFFVLVLFVRLSGNSCGQAGGTQRPFEPSVGQSGKDVIWVPTAQGLVTKMLDLANLSSADILIDLGSGDGRTVIAAAKRGARALGIEFNPDMVEYSTRSAINDGVADKARFVTADIFESDFSEATVITMFLLSDINLKLRPKLLGLKPGTRIVSNTFTMGEWTSDGSASVEDDNSNDEGGYSSFRTALLWIVPAKVAGTWQAGEDELVLRQTFQMVEGTLTHAGRSVGISNGRLRGSELHFTAGDAEYTGVVDGNQMHGTVKRGGESAPWKAILSVGANP